MSARAARPDTEEALSTSRLLLGRERELARLNVLVDGIEGQGGALVVRGEACRAEPRERSEPLLRPFPRSGRVPPPRARSAAPSHRPQEVSREDDRRRP